MGCVICGAVKNKKALYCPDCAYKAHLASARKYYASHKQYDKEKRSIYAHKYYLKNREKMLLASSIYHKKRNAILRAQRPAKPIEVLTAEKAKLRAYYVKNRRRVLDQIHDYYMRNKERISEYKKQWYLKKKGEAQNV